MDAKRGFRRRLAPALLGLVSACTPRGAEESHGSAPQGEPPQAATTSTAAPAGVTCRLLALPGNDNRYDLSLEVHNGDATPLTLRYFAPLDFALKAWIDDEEMLLRVPAQSTAVEPVTTTLAPGASTILPTPVTLSFGTGSRRADRDEPHRWWLDHVPTRTRLLAERAFDSHAALTCAGLLAP